jgi:hypothetical protein
MYMQLMRSLKCYQQMFSGEQPFKGYSNGRARELLYQNHRPLLPEGMGPVGLTDHIWKLIQECWDEDPDVRPKPKVFLEDGVLDPRPMLIPVASERASKYHSSQDSAADPETVTSSSPKPPRSPIKTRSQAKAPVTKEPIAGPSSKQSSSSTSSVSRKRALSGSDQLQPGDANKRNAHAVRVRHQ